MKLAILADIHANLAALEAVIEDMDGWQPDAVVVAGDTVNRGPCPLACLELVQARQKADGWLVVRGNHEDYVIAHADPETPRSGLWFETHRNSFWTYRQLGEDVTTLVEMPFLVALPAPDGGEIRVVHASMLGNRAGIYPETGDEELRRKIAPPPAVLGVGHTHRPLVRRIDRTLVVNVGSVGLPFDGDRRAAYGRLLWQSGAWQAEIIRLDYDWARTERDFFESGFMGESGALADLILDEFYTARSRLYQWARGYQDRVLAGELSMAESVRLALAEIKEERG